MSKAREPEKPEPTEADYRHAYRAVQEKAAEEAMKDFKAGRARNVSEVISELESYVTPLSALSSIEEIIKKQLKGSEATFHGGALKCISVIRESINELIQERQDAKAELLAERKAKISDDTPITEDWLRRVGARFVKGTEDEPDTWSIQCSRTRWICLMRYKEGPEWLCFLEHPSSKAWDTDDKLPDITFQRELVNLAAALGVELKEPDDG